MTKIHIEPSYEDVKPSGFYVYIHLKCSDLKPFYVGKGSGKRGWNAIGRNPKWRNFAAKHRVNVIVCQDLMSEGDAHLLEMWLIAKLRHQGYDLCNMTDGGEGVSGWDATPENRIRMSASRPKKPVNCSLGFRFKSITDAALWLNYMGHPKATVSRVSEAASNRGCMAYGMSWWLDGGEPKDEKKRGWQNAGKGKRKIVRSDGAFYDSIEEAAAHLRTSGLPKALHGNISLACKNAGMVRYGYTWSYV